MSWTNELYNVYEKNCGKADNVPMLLPISHSTANAQIEVTLNENGDFVKAERVPKADAKTVIPVTNDSAARSSGISPHPLTRLWDLCIPTDREDSRLRLIWLRNSVR